MIKFLKYHETILIFYVEYKNIFDHLLINLSLYSGNNFSNLALLLKGIIIFLSEKQPSNASSPIEVTPLGRVMDNKELQPQKRIITNRDNPIGKNDGCQRRTTHKRTITDRGNTIRKSDR